MSGIVKGIAKKAVKAGKDSAGKYAHKKVKKIKRKAVKAAARKVFLERRVKDDELSRRVQRLRSKTDEIEAGIARINKKVDRLEAERAAVFPLSFGKKRQLKDEIEFELCMEYATYEYLRLLMELEESPRKMDKLEARFFNASAAYVDRLMAGSHVSKFAAEIVLVWNARRYVTSRHGREIAKRKRCDMSEMLDKLRNRC